MKNINVIIKLFIITLILETNVTYGGGFEGRAAEQASNAYKTQVSTGLTVSYGTATGSGSGGCCNAGQSCQPISTSSSYIPSFSVYILDKSGNPLNNPGKNLLPISSNITSFTTNAILTVNIFAPSNIASSTPQFFDKNYIVFYTLKSPDGSYIYTDFEQFTSTSIPHFIAINPTGTPATGTTPAAATFPTPSAGTNYSFLGKILAITNFPTGQAAWQILNGISPISQSFLLSVDSSTPANITISKISGTYDAGSFSSGSNPTTFTPSTGGNGLGTLNIMLGGSSTPNITFLGKKLPFTATDLQNGLILNIVITSEQSGNFNLVATLRTTDGTKMRKEALLSNSQNPSPISSLPTSITIQQNSTTILTTDFLSAQISNNTNATNMVLPLNLRFSISQPSGSKNIQVLMI